MTLAPANQVQAAILRCDDKKDDSRVLQLLKDEDDSHHLNSYSDSEELGDHKKETPLRKVNDFFKQIKL